MSFNASTSGVYNRKTFFTNNKALRLDQFNAVFFETTIKDGKMFNPMVPSRIIEMVNAQHKGDEIKPPKKNHPGKKGKGGRKVRK